MEENHDEKFVKKENEEEEDNEGDDGLEKKRKRALLKKILQHNDLLISPKPEIIIYCYKAWQPGFDTLKNQITNIQFNEGILLTITLQT